MKKLFDIFYALMFTGLIAVTFLLLWTINPIVLYFYLSCLALMFVRFSLKVKDPLTKYAAKIMISLDQHWQVIFSPLLNIGVTTEHRFGNEDETASSVVGKNLKATGDLRWKIIEFFLSAILEGGKPHAVPSIEEDE